MDSGNSLSNQKSVKRHRISKQKSEELSKSIIQDFSSFKDDISGESGSDFEEDLKRERHKKGNFSSEEESETDEEMNLSKAKIVEKK